jgi:Fic-DOC domain mobile mystery protein B
LELKPLLDDTKYWIEHETYSPDEIAARFHHRMVLIHPVPNGNGRHARLIADVLLVDVLRREPFTWGKTDLNTAGNVRDAYIAALRAADNHDYNPLLDFVRL